MSPIAEHRLVASSCHFSFQRPERGLASLVSKLRFCFRKTIILTNSYLEMNSVKQLFLAKVGKGADSKPLILLPPAMVLVGLREKF